jgi:hypothetical protein
MELQPRIFIGSSSESIKIANACNVALDHVSEPTTWPYAFDRAGTDALSSLITKAKNSDFALFIFSPDDINIMRDKSQPTVRDNVLFELGLFIGALGKERCFILRPRGEELYIASDLTGINTYEFNANRQDNNTSSAVNAACTRITEQMQSIGRINKVSVEDKVLTPNISKAEFNLKDPHLKLLAELVATHNTYCDGMSFWEVQQKGISFSEPQLHMGLIKLTRCGYIDKSIFEHDNGGADYTFKITNSGIEYLLDNDDRLSELDKVEQEKLEQRQQQWQPQKKQGGFYPKKSSDIPF